LDGGCSGCIGRGNEISELVGVAADNSGAALALFYAENCTFHSNVTHDCKRGIWVGGTNTAGNLVHGNVFAGHGTGIRVNVSPAAGSITFKNNLVVGNVVGIDDDSEATVSTNAWWQNTTDNANGALSAVDAAAVTSDPLLTADYRPLPGSPLIGAGTHTGYTTGMDRNQRFNPPTIGAYEPMRPRDERT
jgi:hypothetical protein